MATGRLSQKTEILKWLQAGYTITRKEIVKERPRVKGARYAVYRLLGRVDDFEGGVNNDTFR